MSAYSCTSLAGGSRRVLYAESCALGAVVWCEVCEWEEGGRCTLNEGEGGERRLVGWAAEGRATEKRKVEPHYGSLGSAEGCSYPCQHCTL